MGDRARCGDCGAPYRRIITGADGSAVNRPTCDHPVTAVVFTCTLCGADYSHRHECPPAAPTAPRPLRAGRLFAAAVLLVVAATGCKLGPPDPRPGPACTGVWPADHCRPT